MSDNLSQDELDKLLAGVEAEADEGGTGDDAGLANAEFSSLESLYSGGWEQLASNMSQSLGQPVTIDFGVAANLPEGAVQDDLETLGVLAHFSLTAGTEARHAIVLQAEEVAKLGALIGGDDPAGATLTADTFQAVLDFFDMSLPIVAAALQNAVSQPVAIGGVEGVNAADPSTEFDADAVGLGGAVVRLEYALSVGDAVTCPLMYTLPLAHAREILSMAPDLPVEVIEPVDRDVTRATFAEFDTAQGRAAPALAGGAENMDLILDIQLEVVARLGSIQMPIREILKLGPGSIIDIDRPADAPVDLVVNEKLVAHGDIVVVQENFGLKISDVLSPQERIASLRQ